MLKLAVQPVITGLDPVIHAFVRKQWMPAGLSPWAEGPRIKSGHDENEND
jgi:hypothetical protein